MSRMQITVVALLVAVFLVGAVGLAAASGPDDTPLAGTPAQALGDVPEIRVRFDGCIDEVDLNEGVGHITVDGFPVEITTDTEVDGELVAEACVRVNALLQLDMTDTPPSLILVATRVRVRGDEHEPRCLEFYGKVVSIDDEDEWHVIGGPPFVVIDATEFKGDTEPGEGDRVKVEICRHPDGYWYAKEIELLHDDDDDEDQVEFRGRIAQIEEGSGDPFEALWKVGRWWVGITEDTEMEGTPRVGALAKIEGRRARDGSRADVIATKAEVENSGEHRRRVKLEAAITATATTTPEAIWEFEGIPVTVDENTVIIDHRVPAEVGAWGDVEAILRDDNTLYARRIKTEDEDEPEGTVYFKGHFQSPADGADGGEDWTISGVTFFVPGDVLEEVDDGPVEGDKVELEAMREEDGDAVRYRVIELDVEREDDD